MYTHTLFLYFTATIFACECAYMAGTEVRGTSAGPVSPSRSPATNSGHAIIRTKQDHLCAKQSKERSRWLAAEMIWLPPGGPLLS
jgi:hypothetical protein